MSSRGHNVKKPKLAGLHAGNAHDQKVSGSAGDGASAGSLGEGAAPEKHKMSFAQHQHEQQSEHTPTPLPEAPTHHLKADAQQHQQKAGKPLSRNNVVR